MPQDIIVKSVLNKTKGRDPWFLDDYTINPYSGCSFNCLYCYIRGSKYGINMAEKVSVKSNTIEVLDRQLYNRARKGQYGLVVLSSATDPYLHFEREERLTRQVLELLIKYRFPVHVITKSDLVVRDLDLLSEINNRAILPEDLEGRLKTKAIISFSFSCIDDNTAQLFEPGATPPKARLETMALCLKNGFFSGVSLMPLLPYISDTGKNLDDMFGLFREMRVDYILPATLTLFGTGTSDSKTLVLRAVEKHYPQLLAKYKTLFANGSQLPKYYNDAFYKKTSELCKLHGLKNRII